MQTLSNSRVSAQAIAWALFFILLQAVLPASSLAQQGSGFGVTIKAGTPGIGGDLTVGLHPKFNMRGGGNVFWYGLTSSEVEDGVTVDFQADLRWLTIPVLLDWHPWESGVRFSLGALVNNNHIDLSAETDNVELNGAEYGVESLDGKISFNALSPYIGIGYGDATDASSRWHVACDVGVMFQGSPQIEMNAVATHQLLQPLLDADLAAEVNELEDEYKEFTLYPVLSVGVSYTF